MDGSTNLPVGPPILMKTGDSGSPPYPARTRLKGESVVLRPVDAEADAKALFAISHGDPETEKLWTYLFTSPFASAEQMKAWLADLETATDSVALTVLSRKDERRLGMASFLNIDPNMRRLELGSIWYAPFAQRSNVNTESIYLMLRHAFEDLGYRRVEWKCDALNARSRKAALRLGFEFEGIFRQHMIIKGHSRDTSWFSMIDGEWPAIRHNMEKWLYDNEAGQLSLSTLNCTLNPFTQKTSEGRGPSEA